MENLSHSQWTGKTGGTPWMQRALITMYRWMPLHMLYGVMALVVPFYMLLYRRGYQSIYRYFRQRMGYGCWKAFLNVYRNHFVFGQVVLDRFAVYAGKKFHFVIDGEEQFSQLADGSEGFVMLSSHVGNYELAGYSLHSVKKKIHALVYDGESATVKEQRSKILSRQNIEVIPVRNDMAHLFAVNGALDEGHIVSMLSDRIFGSQKALTMDFLGSPAKFPQGPFSLARAKGVPMLAIFVMKVKAREYRVLVRRVADAKAFVGTLEQVVRQYPTQWFNYYNFWSTQ